MKPRKKQQKVAKLKRDSEFEDMLRFVERMIYRVEPPDKELKLYAYSEEEMQNILRFFTNAFKKNNTPSGND